jgi:hypothetical protein
MGALAMIYLITTHGPDLVAGVVGLLLLAIVGAGVRGTG